MRLMRLGIKGDTIIEVMIAIAILGGIIGGGYSIATKSLKGVRVSAERSEATKIAEAQIEILQTKLSVVNNLIDVAPYLTAPYYYQYAPSAPATQIAYCFNDAGIRIGMATLPGDSVESVEAYPPGCKRGIAGIYNVAITVSTNPAAPSDASFNVEIRWDRAGGGKEKLRMVYRASVL